MRSVFALSLLLALPAAAQPGWGVFHGPMGEQWSRLGTDGQNLYFTTSQNQLWRYTYPAGAPTLGTWTRLTDAPRNINNWDSYRGLAAQAGYLYTTAKDNVTTYGRTVLRYDLAKNTWEIWGNPTGAGQDLGICNSSGNGLIMAFPPTSQNLGVGYSAWHAGFQWVQFDWNAQTANNRWMGTSGLAVPDAGWTSRNEDVAFDLATLTCYAVKNDRQQGFTAGDVVYSFNLQTATPVLVAAKPWQAGCGQSLEFIPKVHRLNVTGEDELWLFRGGDGANNSGEGWSTAATSDLGIYGLVSQKWTAASTPLPMGDGTDSVRIGDYVFVKACGDAASPTAYNDRFFVASADAVFSFFGTGCPGTGSLTPQIWANGSPALGNAQFQVEVRQALGGSAAALILGASDRLWGATPLPLDLTPFGLSGCSLDVALAFAFPAALTGTGAGNGQGFILQPIPNNPLFAGVSLYYQWLVVDPGAVNNALGVVFSDSARATLK